MAANSVVAIFILVSFLHGSLGDDIGSVTWDASTDTYAIVNGTHDDWVAWGNFSEQITTNGWNFLHIVTKERIPDRVQAYAAGLLEGYLTVDYLYKHWVNTIKGYCSDDPAYCQRLIQYVVSNLSWVVKMIKRYSDTDPYWHQIGMSLEQLKGIEEGYSRSDRHEELDAGLELGFLMFNIDGDLEDLEQALRKQGKLRRVLGSGSCSALVKLLPGNSDLLASHVTWTTYSSMLRIIKRYEIPIHLTNRSEVVVPGYITVMTSSPGRLCSGDDYHLLSSNLLTMETTIGNGNASLWKFVQPTGTVFEWLRTLTANRLATDGRSWHKYFLRFNSGTYNNQWMVVDYNKFQPGDKKLKDGLLWVSEQLPGFSNMSDVTDVLRKQQYWPSYNTPYFPDIFNLSGQPEKVARYGNWFTYDKTPRALIFARDQSKITDLQSGLKLMRYNDFQNDPLSACDCDPPYSAENAISARCDLNPVNGTYPFASLGHRDHGATDAKITSFALFQRKEMVAVYGPTYDPLPPFQWSTSDYNSTASHLGHPDLFQFSPVHVKWI